MSRFCTQCGHQNADDAAFCDSCGKPLATTRDAAAASRKPGRLWVYGLGSTAIVAAAGVVVALALPSGRLQGWAAAVGLRLPTLGSKANAFYMVVKDGKHGYVDRNGDEAIPVQHHWPPTQGLLGLVRRVAPYPLHSEGAWILVDRRGDRVGTARFDDLAYMGSYAGPLVCGRTGGRRSCVDSAGSEVAGLAGLEIEGGSEGLLVYKKGNRVGLASDKGAIVTPAAFKWVAPFVPNAAAAAALFEDGMLGLIDRSGREISKRRYRQAMQPSVATWPVMAGDRWALANLEGEVQRTFGPEILELRSEAEGLMGARTRDGWGFLDIEGRWTIKPRRIVSAVLPFSGQRAVFDTVMSQQGSTQYGSSGLMSRDGGIVCPPPFGPSLVGGAGVVTLRWGGSQWLVDEDGRIVWPKGMHNQGCRKADQAAILGSRWRLMESHEQSDQPFVGSVFEFSGRKMKRQSSGRTFEADFKLVNGQPVEEGDLRAWLFADWMVWIGESSGRVRLFKRMGDSSYAKQSDSRGGGATVGSALSKLLGSGSGGSSVVGRWKDADTEIEFFEDQTLIMKDRSDRDTLNGKWFLLSDGRVKIDFLFLGIPGPPMFGTLESGELVIQSDKLGTMRFSRVN